MELGGVLLFTGAGIAALSAVSLLIALCIFHTKRKRLNAQLNEEYGPKEQQ